MKQNFFGLLDTGPKYNSIPAYDSEEALQGLQWNWVVMEILSCKAFNEWNYSWMKKIADQSTGSKIPLNT